MSIHERQVNEAFASRPVVSPLDTLVGPEAVYMSNSERLTAKLGLIMEDPDVVFAIGSYMSQLIIPGKVAQGGLTEEQGERVIDISRRTLDAMLTPEQREAARREAEEIRDRPSPFAGR